LKGEKTMRETAMSIYLNLIDMDYMDYAETLEDDLDYICSLLKSHSPEEKQEILEEIRY
jgi:hypothetical protein